MPKPGKTSLSIDLDSFAKFNELKIRIIASKGAIPSGMRMLAALIELGGMHYEELLSIMAKAEGEGNEDV